MVRCPWQPIEPTWYTNIRTLVTYTTVKDIGWLSRRKTEV